MACAAVHSALRDNLGSRRLRRRELGENKSKNGAEKGQKNEIIMFREEIK